MNRLSGSACPVCGVRLTSNFRNNSSKCGYNIDCPRCGMFNFSEDLLDDLPKLKYNERQLAAVSYAIRQRQKPKHWPTFTSDVFMKIARECYLPSPAEQVDNLILWIGQKQPNPGERVKINIRDHRAIAGSSTDSGLIFVLSGMLDQDYVSGTKQLFCIEYNDERGGNFNDGEANVVLTFRGWERFEELKRGGGSGFTAFMAMKFGDAELDGMLTSSFRDAVKSTGFSLRKLDDNPKAGLIDDRLRVEIKACRFLVADLTHANAGAYWEAGFAEGLGKPVIYTCKESVFNDPEKRPHFDTNHHLTVLWDPQKPCEAAERLKATIRATLPEAKQQD